MQSGREDTLEERYAIKFCFKLGKNVTEMYGMLQTDEVKIKTGIFLRDAQSLSLFVKTMMSHKLIRSKCTGGYKLHKSHKKD